MAKIKIGCYHKYWIDIIYMIKFNKLLSFNDMTFGD